jgi:hypothetical protein
MATVELRSEEDSEDEGEMSMYCITCGHEIHSRMAIKHMEKCFNKVFLKIYQHELSIIVCLTLS